MGSTINFELALMGLAIHIFIWNKLPDWGTWFPKMIKLLPKPLQKLYEGWQCPYCFGFWVALALHWLTGIQTLPALSNLANSGIVGLPVAWFLDALATATLIYFGSHILGTLSWGAAKGYFATQEFKASFTNKEDKQNE
ncbi:hypothetical protein [Christiangramia echinicola]|uniref:hypothetical protein n=1 Tax=Christiangramia echinicola TaxID=279359 RepID=UPI0004140448|nr:hypothetical protein [Christiangramia echinicola]